MKGGVHPSPFAAPSVPGSKKVPIYCLADRGFSSRRMAKPGPEVIKLFSCSTQLSMKFSPLINVKMPTIVGILTCMSGKNNILGLTEP